MGNERGLVNRLLETVRRGRRVALVLGSGVTAEVVPGVEQMLEMAEEYARDVLSNPDLLAALNNARTTTATAADTYAVYRHTFAEWLSPIEFDILIQRAVLAARRSPVTTPSTWERIGFQRGAQLEEELSQWRVPEGVAALGNLLVRLPGRFGRRVLTTNFDPLLEIAVRRAGGSARSLSLKRDGSFASLVSGQDTVDVVHLHGYWRPTTEADERSLLHDPEQLRARRPNLASELADVLRDETVCVVGYGGWDDVFTEALHDLVTARAIDVLWAVHHESRRPATVPSSTDPSLVYYGVDSDRLFPAVLHAIAEPDLPGDRVVGHTVLTDESSQPSPPGTPQPGSSVHRVRMPRLERTLGIRLSADELLRQLDRDFNWRLERNLDTPVGVLFWPVKLRPPTLIYAVQAVVAAALSARGVRVVLCLDDFARDEHVEQWRAVFTAEVVRWFRLVDGSRPPKIESLSEFCSAVRMVERLQDPRLLARPTHPWAVQLEYYRQQRTLYEIVQLTKAIPPPDADTERVVSGLANTWADRLISTPAIWAYLQYLLERTPRAHAVLTLGGDDEAIVWRHWQETFPGDPVVNLYHPVLANLRQDASMLRARSRTEVEEHLEAARGLPEWASEGHYLHWTVHNAILLPQYLRNRPPPTVSQRLDSWETISVLLADGRNRRSVVRALAREIGALILHDSG